jgi:hypothetical protein
MSQDQPETLDSHGGEPRRGGGRRTAIAVAGVAAVAVAGGAAWAAWSFFSTGDQPAEALPATTIAYASVDLDPSGGQKIEALRTLKKFPAFEDAVGLDTDDDVRRWIFDEIQGEAGCDGLDYDDDVEPWLGDRFAVAAVDTGDDGPAPVFVLQVSDEGAADDGLSAIRDCAGGDDAGAWSIDNGWALVAETQEIADQVADATADGSLADDADFGSWMGETGDSGIVSLYAAPGAGDVIAQELEGLISPAMVEEELGSGITITDTPVPDETLDLLKDFRGAAATLRFDDGGLELEVAADASATGSMANGDAAGDAVASLPEGTVAAFGLSLGEGWFDDLLTQLTEVTGESVDDLIAEASEELGITLPDDAETLAGDALAVSVDEDFDPESLFSSPEVLGSQPSVGLGVKILGDADAIDGVLDKVRTAAAGADGGFLDSETGDGAVAVGPDADYRQELLDDQGLGDTDAYQKVVEHSDDAAAVFFLNFDASDDWLAELAGDDAEVRDNLEPLAALGLSSWLDGETTHAVLKVTSD